MALFFSASRSKKLIEFGFVQCLRRACGEEGQQQEGREQYFSFHERLSHGTQAHEEDRA